MDMEVTAWMSLYHAMSAHEERRPFSRATLRRIAAFDHVQTMPVAFFTRTRTGALLVERGTHTGLSAAGGRYAELYDTQFATA